VVWLQLHKVKPDGLARATIRKARAKRLKRKAQGKGQTTDWAKGGAFKKKRRK
jgi:hypothetical protein